MSEDMSWVDIPHDPVILNGNDVVHDSAFWSYRYQGLPGVSDEQNHAYYVRVMGCEDDPGLLENVPDLVAGSDLYIPFPEGFTWRIAFWPYGIGHRIFHPEIYPDGVTLADESGSPFLPGLRWPELRQIATCLASDWQGTFDVHAIIPLLFPVVESVTFEEAEEVRHRLLMELEALKLIDAPPLEPWLDQMMKVYDHGQFFIHDPVSGWRPETEGEEGEEEAEPMWVSTPDRGWHTPTSQGYRQESSDQFAAFFAMLDRCAPSAL